MTHAAQVKLKACQKELADERRRRAYDAADLQSSVHSARVKTGKLAADALWKVRVKMLFLGNVWSGWEQAVAKRRFLLAAVRLCLRRARNRKVLGCFRCWQALAERVSASACVLFFPERLRPGYVAQSIVRELPSGDWRLQMVGGRPALVRRRDVPDARRGLEPQAEEFGVLGWWAVLV